MLDPPEWPKTPDKQEKRRGMDPDVLELGKVVLDHLQAQRRFDMVLGGGLLVVFALLAYVVYRYEQLEKRLDRLEAMPSTVARWHPPDAG